MSFSSSRDDRTIVVVDVAGFTDPTRRLPDQLAVRQGMYEALKIAFADSDVGEMIRTGSAARFAGCGSGPRWRSSDSQPESLCALLLAAGRSADVAARSRETSGNPPSTNSNTWSTG